MMNIDKNKNILIFIFALFIGIKTYAQENFVHYSVEYGLPSSEIYTLIQDDNNYMWFGTTKGVSRFDGYKFTSYTAANGLPSNSVIRMFKDNNGRIWFSTYDGSLSYYKNGKIYPFAQNDTLLKIDKHYYIFNLFFDNKGTLWIMPSRGGIYQFFPNGNIKKFKVKHNKRAFFFKQINNNFIYTTVPGNKSDTLKLVHNKQGYFLEGYKTAFRADIAKLKKNKYAISLDNQLIIINNDKIDTLIEFKNSITGIYYEENNLWVSVMFEGVYQLDANTLETKTTLLRNKTPVKVFKDKEGGYWFGTIESGIYYTPSFQFNYFLNYNIMAMDIADNELYFATFARFILFKCGIKNGHFLHLDNILLPENFNTNIQDLLIASDGSLWLLGKKLIKIKDGKAKIIDKISGGFKIIENPKGHILITSKNGFKEYVNDTLYFEYTTNKYMISNSIYRDSSGTVWLGSITGLYSYKDSLIYWGNKNPKLKTRINDIKPFKNKLLLATNGSGLFVFDPATNDLIIIDKTHSNINSDFVNVIFVDTPYIWIGTNKGLAKILINFGKGNFNFSIEKFSKSDGLYSEEIKEILKKDNYFYLGTSKGLVSFQPEKLKKNPASPKLTIEKLLINGKEFPISNIIKLKPSQNNITIYFKGLSFRAQGEVFYKYRLIGLEENWTLTTQRYVRYPNLPTGTYTFEIYSSADGQIWNKTPKKIIFEIPKPFTHTIYFALLIILSITGIIYFVIWIRYRNISKQLEYRKRLILAEQKALRSQMNPHFIFNALNSIRRYILDNDELKADYYLTSFATLMRKVLDNSKKDLIPLTEEIDTLKLYIELEKMRLENGFDFKLYIDEKINPEEIFIPPMLIQPLLENSIWHGLAPKKDKGLLILSFEKYKNLLKITVQDNGIGRDKATEISQKRKGHKSTGLSNIRDRIRYLSILTRSRLKMHIEDLYDNNHQPTGTKITLLIDYQSLMRIYRIE